MQHAKTVEGIKGQEKATALSYSALLSYPPHDALKTVQEDSQFSTAARTEAADDEAM